MFLKPLKFLNLQFSVSSLLSFIQTPSFSLSSTIYLFFSEAKTLVNRMATDSMSRRCILKIGVDMKLPYLVLHEHGSLQRLVYEQISYE